MCCSEKHRIPMNELTSRRNPLIRHLRELSGDSQLRKKESLFVCDGEKLLEEALRSDAEIAQVFWKETRVTKWPVFPEEYLLPEDLFDYTSPMKNSPGPLFTVRMQEEQLETTPQRALLLEELQDPGNVGTVLRTADAFGIDVVILLESCADVFAPKTVRASMGAVFRQRVLQLTGGKAVEQCRSWGLPLYAAALSAGAKDLRELDLHHVAVAVGSEGHGLSAELRKKCDGELIIPMCGGAESLNAAMAATIIMWEMRR